MPGADGGRSRTGFVATALTTVALAVVLGAGGCSATSNGTATGSSLSDRQAEVAAKGATVMPFDLAATTHTFTTTSDGGVQAVTAKDPNDTGQIELIRGHLRAERDNFARGDYDDPAAIHGHNMEGVAELRAGYTRITVVYADRPAGGQLTYSTADPGLIDAIHAWFARQLADHGPDAHAG